MKDLEFLYTIKDDFVCQNIERFIEDLKENSGQILILSTKNKDIYIEGMKEISLNKTSRKIYNKILEKYASHLNTKEKNKLINMMDDMSIDEIVEFFKDVDEYWGKNGEIIGKPQFKFYKLLLQKKMNNVNS